MVFVDVVIVIGVNDVVNLVVVCDCSLLIYGMLIINVYEVWMVICLKCGKGMGFFGIEN